MWFVNKDAIKRSYKQMIALPEHFTHLTFSTFVRSNNDLQPNHLYKSVLPMQYLYEKMSENLAIRELGIFDNKSKYTSVILLVLKNFNHICIRGTLPLNCHKHTLLR